MIAANLPRVDDPTLDLSQFTREERELLVKLASSLIESKVQSVVGNPALQLWLSYSAKPPAVEDEAEAERIALEAVAEARGRL